MKILALEFSSDQRSIAIVQEKAGAVSFAERVETGGRSGRPFALIDELLRETMLEPRDIDCVAVGLGPGSYNGIRASISMAQGWQLASGTRVLGLSSIDCLIESVPRTTKRGRLNLVIDAQRNEYYLADFEIDDGVTKPLEPLRVVASAQVAARQQAGETIAGPDISRRFPGAIDVWPSATVLGKLALGRQDFVSGETLQPIYLRETAFVKAPPARIVPF